jgi:hypothetical protein
MRHHSPLYSADQKEMPALEGRKTVTRGRNVIIFARYFVSYSRPGISRSQRVSRAASGFRVHHPGCVLRAVVQRGRHGLLHGRWYCSRFSFGAGSKSVKINTAGFRKKRAPCTECQYTSECRRDDNKILHLQSVVQVFAGHSLSRSPRVR